MMITRWKPFSDRAFDRCVAANFEARGWKPSIDIFEREDALVVRAELPGVAKDEIDVRIENEILHLEGERGTGAETEPVAVHRRERLFGRFSRSFSLPQTVDPSKIEASHKDGVLEIVLPKLEQVKPRKIEIRAA
jgi:HSP20 family protein